MLGKLKQHKQVSEPCCFLQMQMLTSKYYQSPRAIQAQEQY